MFTRTTIAAALISLTTLAAVPAQASHLNVEIGIGAPDHGWNGGHGHRYVHGDYHRMHRLSTEEVRWMLRDSGYRQIRFLDDHGSVYQLRARRHDDAFFLAVSARTGEILSRNRI
jgi:hypothetical protein